ncbi:hypothetical protein BGZ97_010287 [Linnemannia gamsii]|uniref:Uncharacterized protein n=1 Tax=Linnemannia gamsii TaxID=64522 RepID=A0A9P6R657_9FUNG|nr:hypothetical protein BGZ97_010287 [Linnemannia gamsii]
MRLPFLYSHPGASSPAPAPAPSKQQSPLSFKTVFLLFTAALCSFLPTVVAQDQAPPPITYAFYDASGNQIGDSFPLYKVNCTTLNVDSLQGQAYASVRTSQDRSALNLYSEGMCQFATASSVGNWPNTSPTENIFAVRWEGDAPADRATGNVSLHAFEKGLAVQPYNPVNDDGTTKNPVWVVDPTKGRIVVAAVSAVMVIGVAIGIYQVYVAAQYKPPPKKPKKPKTGLNVKKIKKKDAYYRKPVRAAEDGATFQRLENNDSPEPYAVAGGRQPALAMTERSRDSQYSEAATFVDWNNQSQHRSSPLSSSNGKGFQDGLNSVSIDMHNTHQGNNNNNNTNNNNGNRSPFANSFSPDLIQFDNSGGRGYGQQQQQQGYNTQPYRGRGGEVLVPMDTLDSHNHHHNINQYNNNHNSRSAVRRTSSSRSR